MLVSLSFFFSPFVSRAHLPAFLSRRSTTILPRLSLLKSFVVVARIAAIASEPLSCVGFRVFLIFVPLSFPPVFWGTSSNRLLR